jgi:hypothetical protein
MQAETNAQLEGSSADQIAAEPIVLFNGPKPGRKLYCRIDRENGVLNTTYRMYLEAVRPIGNPDDEILDTREEFMFAARKLKSSYNANYHIFDTADLSGNYCGKVRSAKRGIGSSFAAGKQYNIYDAGRTADDEKTGMGRVGRRMSAARQSVGAMGEAMFGASKENGAGAAAGNQEADEGDEGRKEVGCCSFRAEDNLNMVSLVCHKRGKSTPSHRAKFSCCPAFCPARGPDI